MVKKIEVVRQQLYTLIDEDASYDSIVTKSVELDLLISSYYQVDLRDIT
ncbi:MAG: hypothetical protein K0Q99_191 [Clostridia bacterium]|jgi:hypothetical protein|nr:hypothetical protein [Clostridia bacterium]